MKCHHREKYLKIFIWLECAKIVVNNNYYYLKKIYIYIFLLFGRLKIFPLFLERINKFCHSLLNEFEI